ncbi:hypothetical protein TrST_g1894 [Triparma strigata]|uniref:Malic enzyme n=1 Tax=Triparma strigata TaxID=1606541 RepID=A0A9W7EWI5_9STRA|nr:hypothetical protein TrST_g1894 [Triparma strigata]
MKFTTAVALLSSLISVQGFLPASAPSPNLFGVPTLLSSSRFSNASPSAPSSSPARALGEVPPAGSRIPPTVQVETAWKRAQTLLNAIDRASPEEKGDLELTLYQNLQTLSYTSPDTFYALITAHLPALMPFVYTPVVGAACVNWYEVAGHAAINTGVFVDGFSSDKASIKKQLEDYRDNKSAGGVDAIVVTDGERILGLGDLGANGMGIPCGKLHLYTACGGVNPGKCLPVTLDCGCNVDEIREKDTYAGVKRKRDMSVEQFDKLVQNFMEASMEVFGREVLIQFEDFGNGNAFRVLEDWQPKATCFNDDIQGTASVVLGGLIASLRLTPEVASLKDHKFVFLGAGEAGVGIANLIAYAIRAETGCSDEESYKNIHLVDSKGLVSKSRTDDLAHHKLPYAHDVGEAKTLEEAVQLIKPTAIVGVSAQPQTFTESVIKHMAKTNKNPIVFALSNPTSKAECTAEQAYKWSDGNCVFASGSPFAPVEIAGKTKIPGQGNNAYVFPGIGLGALTAGSSSVSDNDMYIAAKSLSETVGQDRLDAGCLYPPLGDIRDVSKKIATDIATKAWEDGIARHPKPADVSKAVEERMWSPFD